MVIAGLIAAAMSTFDSTLNAGASYMVRDIYQTYIKPEADDRDLMWASRISTVALCVAGVLLAAVVRNINQIWGLITMGLGAGLFVPLFLRWYWPRFNGYGFAAGTGCGMVAAIVFKVVFTGWPLYHTFPAILLCALAGSIAGTLLTKPVDEDILVNFYLQINPWGFWGEYADKAQKKGLITEKERLRRTIEKLNDAVALCFAVPFQWSVLLAAMSFVFHAWEKFAVFSSMTLLCGLGLYFFWYRSLKDEEDCAREDEIFDEKTRSLCSVSVSD